MRLGGDTESLLFFPVGAQARGPGPQEADVESSTGQLHCLGSSQSLILTLWPQTQKHKHMNMQLHEMSSISDSGSFQ